MDTFLTTVDKFVDDEDKIVRCIFNLWYGTLWYCFLATLITFAWKTGVHQLLCHAFQVLWSKSVSYLLSKHNGGHKWMPNIVKSICRTSLWTSCYCTTKIDRKATSMQYCRRKATEICVIRAHFVLLFQLLDHGQRFDTIVLVVVLNFKYQAEFDLSPTLTSTPRRAQWYLAFHFCVL